MSTSGGVQNIGGFMSTSGRYHEYIGGIQYIGGYHDACGEYHEYMGDIMSTSGDAHYTGAFNIN